MNSFQAFLATAAALTITYGAVGAFAWSAVDAVHDEICANLNGPVPENCK